MSFYSKNDQLSPKEVLLVSAIEQIGMNEVIDSINKIVSHNQSNHIFNNRREDQLKYWIKEEIQNHIQVKFDLKINTDNELAKNTKKVVEGKIGIYEVANSFLAKFLK